MYAERSNPEKLEEEGFSYPPQPEGSSGGSTGGSSSQSSPLGARVTASPEQFNFDGLNGKTY